MRALVCIAFILALLAGAFFLFKTHHPASRAGGVPAMNAFRPGAAIPSQEPLSKAEETAESAALRPEIEPEKVGWTLTGRVVRSRESKEDATAPVGGAVIRLKLNPQGEAPKSDFKPQERVTGADGHFDLSGVPAQVSLRLEVDEPASAYEAFTFELPGLNKEPRADLGDILLEEPTTVTVQLVDSMGQPIEKGRVRVDLAYLVDLERELHLSTVSREAEERGTGEYVLERAAGRRSYVEASARGFAPATGSVDLPREEPLRIHLEEGARIAGVVYSSSGAPIEKAKIKIDDSPSAEAESDSQGRFVLDSLPADGLLTLSATAEGFHSSERKVDAGREDVEIWLFQEAVLAGSVFSEEDSTPLVQARVDLHPSDGGAEVFSGVTDANGRFEIKKILPGKYTAEVDHDDFVPIKTGPWDLSEGARIQDQVLRLRKGFSVRGKVIDSETEAPISKATVKAELETEETEPGLERREWTDAGGAFQLTGLREGNYRISTEARGYSGSVTHAVIRPNDLTELILSLERGSSISGRVLDPEGRPLAGVAVSLAATLPTPEAVENRITSGSRTNARGRYILDNLPEFSGYCVIAEHMSFTTARLPNIAVQQGAKLKDLNLKLGRGGRIQGRVLDATGKGMRGASVLASPVGESDSEPLIRHYFTPTSKSSESQEGGSFEILHLEPGTYAVRACSNGWVSTGETTVCVSEGETTQGIDLAFRRGETLSGRVVDSLGRPVKEAIVRAELAEAAAVATDADGRFELRGLEAGKADVTATKDGLLPKSLWARVPGQDLLFTLGPLARVTGRVQAAGRKSFPHGDITLRTWKANWNQEESSASIDETGRFDLLVTPGRQLLLVSDPGFGKKLMEISLGAGERRDLVIPIAKAGKIEGRVVARGSGQPISNAEVSWEPWEASGWETASSDGTFALEGVPEGPVALLARNPAFTSARIEGIAVRAGQTTQVLIELGEGRGVQGSVRKERQPVSGAKVSARKLDGGLTREAVTSPDGLYEIGNLPAGDYEVSSEAKASDGSVVRIKESVTVHQERFTRVDLELGAVVLSGRVLRRELPVKEAQIAVHLDGEAVAEGQTDAAGKYSFGLRGQRTYLFTVQGNGIEELELELTLPEAPAEVTQDFDLR